MIKIYTNQLTKSLPRIFGAKNHFLRTFGGELQTAANVEQKDRYMNLKTTDTDVVIQEYNTGENVAFGTGTGNSNRFGPRHEVKSIDTQIEYEAPLSIHDGIDDVTVGDIKEEVVAERLALHSEAWAEHLNSVFSKALSDSAATTLEGELTEAGVIEVFNSARKEFTNNKVSRTFARVAYVTSEVYNIIMDSKLATTGKSSSVNIDTGEVLKFKGFEIEEVADEYFTGDENIYFAADNAGVAGVGVQIARVLDSEDFAGVAIQGAAKYAQFIPEKNKKAIVKAVLTEEVLEG